MVRGVISSRVTILACSVLRARWQPWSGPDQLSGIFPILALRGAPTRELDCLYELSGGASECGLSELSVLTLRTLLPVDPFLSLEERYRVGKQFYVIPPWFVYMFTPGNYASHRVLRPGTCLRLGGSQ